MPCSDSGYEYNDCRKEVQKIHKLTELLCTACAELENHDDAVFTPSLASWWMEHKREDAERREREAEAMAQYRLEMKAYKKLTPDERKMLGVRQPRKP